MNEYTITRTQGQIDWAQIPALKIEYQLRPTDCPVTAQAQVCYDEEALHIRLRAVEEHIRAEHFGPLGEICEDSCLEFFFSPIPGDRRYFNIECNPNGAMYLGMGSDAHNLVRFVAEEPAIKPVPERTADGWQVTYAIPYTFIRQFFPEFKAEGHIRANCYKCGDKTVQKHFFTWNPTPVLPYASFHNPDGFGIMYFG